MKWGRGQPVQSTSSAKNWTGIIALIISAVSMSTSVWNSCEVRSYHRILAKPHISMSFYHQSQRGAGWRLSQSGNGPAIIGSFEATLDDIQLISWTDLARRLQITPATEFEYSIPAPGTLLNRGASRIFWIDNSDDSKTLIANQHRLRLSLCYCSLYGECWITEDKSTPGIGRQQRKVKECKDSDGILFNLP